MQAKALLLCIAVAGALNVNLNAAEQPGVPPGWTTSAETGQHYEVGYDSKEGATYLRSTGEPGLSLGGLQQAIAAQPYVGKDLQLKAEIKVEGEPSRAELYLRAITGDQQHAGASWNTPKEWTPISVQLGDAVKPDASSVDFGIILQGKGRVWIRNLTLSAVDPTKRLAHNAPLHTELPVPAAVSRPSNLALRP